jgi:hypothetical protein
VLVLVVAALHDEDDLVDARRLEAPQVLAQLIRRADRAADPAGPAALALDAGL